MGVVFEWKKQTNKLTVNDKQAGLLLSAVCQQHIYRVQSRQLLLLVLEISQCSILPGDALDELLLILIQTHSKGCPIVAASHLYLVHFHLGYGDVLPGDTWREKESEDCDYI